jgi:hypothetical protein
MILTCPKTVHYIHPHIHYINLYLDHFYSAFDYLYSHPYHFNSYLYYFHPDFNVFHSHSDHNLSKLDDIDPHFNNFKQGAADFEQHEPHRHDHFQAYYHLSSHSIDL